MYHNADRRRTIGKITAAMPGMDGDMWTLAQQTLSKLKRMTDSDYDSQKFYFILFLNKTLQIISVI